MKASWKFFAGLVAGFMLALGLTATAFCLNLGVSTGTSRWAFQLNQIKRQLADRTPSRNSCWWAAPHAVRVSAREIQSKRHAHGKPQHPCRLGTTYILDLAQKAAKPGDTVLLVLEYELYNYGKVEQTWADKLLVDYLVSRDPAFVRRLSLREQWTIFMLTSHSRLLEGLKNRLRTEHPYDDEGMGVTAPAISTNGAT